MKTIHHIYWALLVKDMTGVDLERIQDNTYNVLPFKKIIPNPLFGLPTLEYIEEGADCDDRVYIAIVEIRRKLRRIIHKTKKFIPITHVVGWVRGLKKKHEFLLIGGQGADGQLVGRYYHRLGDRYEEIDRTQITKVELVW